MAARRTQIDRILAGDGKAFEEFVAQYQRLVSHVVFRMIDNRADREDVCQDVFLKIHGSLSGFRFESKLSTWVARVAYNKCLNYIEKKKLPLFEDLCGEDESIDSVAGEQVQPDALVEQKDLSNRLRCEIDNLPVPFRAILTLYHLDEMSYREIGRIMEMPEGTVKSYLHRARRLLRERLLAKYQPEEL